uniref:Sigma-70, region 4 n=1 Tax=Candidatus Kentrum sp. MB TaxID=2138164 RepID=A0A450XU88_9GAMM|nr:MAG: hypothetical protein BECKMB1821G_GA0114241_11293 [Candidatus Kentron sp. MB]VFK35621.1 MAG: hypothetical protein BECKMB1821I_GA0114274_11323 [Candidatus Kentron sp. MB]VFK77421.1 MAG: hypothetical protein BECKMB1821H_GA0114242_11363 [Candidatus Kentron sp. MB]
MQKIHDILRLKYESKLSHEKIAGALGLSKGAVSKYISQAQVQGLFTNQVFFHGRSWEIRHWVLPFSSKPYGSSLPTISP